MRKKYDKERAEVNQKWNEIEPQELDRLRAAMNEKTQERMNGKLQMRFFQVMYDWNVLKLMDDGRPMVMNPFEYYKWNRANSMIEAADRKKEERLFEAFPEERVKADAKRARWISETRQMMKLINKSV